MTDERHPRQLAPARVYLRTPEGDVRALRCADKADRWLDTEAPDGWELIDSMPTLELLDGTPVPATESRKHADRATWLRFVVPVGTAAVLARWETSRVTSYALRNPDDAPRNLAERITPAEWAALRAADAEDDDDYDERRARHYRAERENGPAVVRTILLDTSSVRQLTVDQPASLSDFTTEQLGQWHPVDVLAELYGPAFGPWLPGSLDFLTQAVELAQSLGHRVDVNGGYVFGPNRAFVGFRVDVRVPYDPPRTVRVAPERGARRKGQAATMRSVWETVTVTVNAPVTIPGTDLASALADRDRRLAEIAEQLATAASWHVCGHCQGLGAILRTRPGAEAAYPDVTPHAPA